MSIEIEVTHISRYKTDNYAPADVKLESFIFSGGELQVKIAPYSAGVIERVKITAHLTSSDEIMKLIMTVDACRRHFKYAKLDLLCPYLPYARQDRVMNTGEALALKVMCGIINDLKFDTVTVWDVHSDVSLALLDRVVNVEQSAFLYSLPVDKNKCVLVSPDAGANKKVIKIATNYKLPMVRADKTRSVEDGSITGTVVYSEHIGDKNFLIVDDICDGGRTFIELAKVLRPLTNGKIYLYVTHGIFSQGLHVFEGLIDHIYTANVFPNVSLDTSLTILNYGIGH